MHQNLISIIIPIYKVEKYLNKCIESIVNQTYNNIEIILIDDGSPDNCPAICDEWTKIDSRIKTIHRKNGGLSAARNTGIEFANGDYLFFVDSDDFIEKDCIETLIEIGKNNCDIVITNPIQYIDNSYGRKLYNTDNLQGYISHDKALTEMLKLKSFSWNAWGKLFKKNLFDSLIFPEGRNYEDLYLIPSIFDRATNIYLTSTHKYFYRMREDSIVNAPKTIKNLEDYLIAAETVFKNFYKRKQINIQNAVIWNYSTRLVEIMYHLISSKLVTNENSKFINRVFNNIKYIRKKALKQNNLALSSKMYLLSTLFGIRCFSLLVTISLIKRILRLKILR